MNVRISFSRQAIADLQSIYDYIAPRGGQRIARDYVARLYAYCLDFRAFSRTGRPS
ncbi:MAG: type II toxin-antitoxin system RelE/ParE family toxin [Bosea sp.]|nr:type II toxin-antitoxin system RelE/ParE family toxin [Bosea sp. (in: a-proteobacteria)]MCP4733495.1 type II toxin-antitoxin system RelE/ParE family toxin [Bosea sp. (in: a-proteobacteria)]